MVKTDVAMAVQISYLEKMKKKRLGESWGALHHQPLGISFCRFTGAVRFMA